MTTLLSKLPRSHSPAEAEDEVRETAHCRLSSLVLRCCCSATLP